MLFFIQVSPSVFYCYFPLNPVFKHL